jgi:hypothetical protein
LPPRNAQHPRLPGSSVTGDRPARGSITVVLPEDAASSTEFKRYLEVEKKLLPRDPGKNCFFRVVQFLRPGSGLF